jgi:sulfate adenylyltransferase subunit 2
MNSYHLDHLQYLETEAIHIMREVAGEFERPALLFSGGKGSVCLLRLAEKAFCPSDIPMPFLNIEAGDEPPNFLAFRDQRAKEAGVRLIVRTVNDAMSDGSVVLSKNEINRKKLQIPVLLDAIKEFQFDCAIGGARRDEGKARAKERFFSFRDSFGQWDPKGQRPEIWNLYNARVNPGENMRVFPLSNWTKRDIEIYIIREGLKLSTNWSN